MGCAKETNISLIQKFQNKALRCVVNAPWFIRTDDLHQDLGIPLVKQEIKKMAAPTGCLQYYTDLSGTVMSFNYGATINGALVTLLDGTTRADSRQLANLNYGICVEMVPGYCSVQWSQGGDPISFTVSGNTVLQTVSQGLPSGGIIGELCTTDFVMIPSPTYVVGTLAGTAVPCDRFCGNEFPTVLYKY